MKTTTLALLFIILISFSNSVFSQEDGETVENKASESISNIQIGLSGRVTNFYMIDQIQSTISLPILFNKKIKIEPEISYFSEKVENPITSSFNDNAFLHIGLCGAMLKSYKDGLLTLGIRAAYIKSWVDGESGSSTNYFAGPVIGYDHFLSDNFSIGMDVNPTFMKVDLKTVFKTNTSVKVSFFF